MPRKIPRYARDHGAYHIKLAPLVPWLRHVEAPEALLYVVEVRRVELLSEQDSAKVTTSVVLF